MGMLLVLACGDESSGATFPAADLVRFDGATLAEGVYDPRDGDLVIEGATADGHDWALAMVDGVVLVGVPEASELRRYRLDGNDAPAGEVMGAAGVGEGYGAAVSGFGAAVVVGAPGSDGGPDGAQAGAVTVLGEPPATYVGGTAQGRLGGVVAACGDIDGDGVAEVAAAALWEADLAGRVYVGSADGRRELTALEGAGPNDRFGAAIDCGPDRFSDAGSDLFVGAPFGAGADGTTRGGTVAAFDAAALAAGTPSFTLDLRTGTQDAFGASLASCRLRTSAYRDLVVGAPLANDGSGGVYIYFGGDGVDAESRPSVTLAGKGTDARFGAHLGCGDLDGDGLDELLVGAPGLDSDAGNHDVGAIYVYRAMGSSAGTFTTTAAHQVFTADRAFLRTGETFVVGDLDADGRAELVLVARQRARSGE
ncbi:MAG: VCBS repeat-containing protein [Myxococcales bacterium]|nr:VCBS repeat-containing protein [Myxococcales bacterium]